MHLRPDGRGTVRLKSPDPLAAPEIRFNFLKSSYDYEALIAGMRICREIASQAALKPYIAEEVLPGPQVTGEAELKADIRARGVSNLHPVGTCRMGRETDSVVDSQLRVHGVAGLRVADASIMPVIVAGNTNAQLDTLVLSQAEGAPGVYANFVNPEAFYALYGMELCGGAGACNRPPIDGTELPIR